MLGTAKTVYAEEEEVAIQRLNASYRRVLSDGGRGYDAGYSACRTFLDRLEEVARTMKIDTASRSYRENFSINYRMLFPEYDSLHYRVDIFEASMEQIGVMWVNGERFAFSKEVLLRAEAFQGSYFNLLELLDRWSDATEQRRPMSRPLRSEMWQALVSLDEGWANFEQKYIAELIDVEKQARSLIHEAIWHSKVLQSLEAKANFDEEILESDSKFKEKRKEFVQCIAKLNSVSNFSRKGRDDLTVDVLTDAKATLRKCAVAEEHHLFEYTRAARVLAGTVVESYTAMRNYLRKLEMCVERVDPHLSNNAGLVARLVDWEESWEAGAKYVQNSHILAAICDLVAEIQAAQKMIPELTRMCDDYDVELFLVLPRIMWLRFLATPWKHTELLRSLLPEFRFGDAKGGQDEPAYDSDLRGFVEKFHKVKELLSGAQPGVMTVEQAEAKAWELLMKRAVLGTQDAEAVYGSVAPACQEMAQRVVEDLMMQDLERFSMELQRHCPEDWNACSAILVQCLHDDGHKTQEGCDDFNGDFQV